MRRLHIKVSDQERDTHTHTHTHTTHTHAHTHTHTKRRHNEDKREGSSTRGGAVSEATMHSMISEAGLRVLQCPAHAVQNSKSNKTNIDTQQTRTWLDLVIATSTGHLTHPC